MTGASDDGAEVRDAIDRLPTDLAEIVRLVHWGGFTIAEAATLTGTPASTARGRNQRAREVLRDALTASPAPGAWRHKLDRLRRAAFKASEHPPHPVGVTHRASGHPAPANDPLAEHRRALDVEC